MIGEMVTIVRVKESIGFLTYRRELETFTTKGVITDVTKDSEGTVTGVYVDGVRVETGTHRHDWFAVGQGALDGNMCTEQTATLDACGCAVTDQCACSLRTAPVGGRSQWEINETSLPG